MPPERLVIKLLSDTTIASGTGSPGVVDTEVVYDETGLPFIPGKIIHGLLRESWLSMRPHFPGLEDAAKALLGQEGELLSSAILRIGDAVLSQEVRQWADYAVKRERTPLRPESILETLTDIREQTALSRQTEGPDEHTLRATRVILRDLSFEARLQWLEEPPREVEQCLAMCVLGTRHVGLARSRGRGFVMITLRGVPEDNDWLEKSRALARGEDFP